MTDITTWAAATAEDGRRTGPEKAVAAHLLDVVKRWRERVDGLVALEEEHRQHILGLEDAIGCCVRERLGIVKMLAELCGPLAPAAAPAVQKPDRTRKAKIEPTRQTTTETVTIQPPADALVIPAALDRRAAE